MEKSFEPFKDRVPIATFGRIRSVRGADEEGSADAARRSAFWGAHSLHSLERHIHSAQRVSIYIYIYIFIYNITTYLHIRTHI